ncbi:paraneoplastic antigen Ma1 homolog [Gadus macrocephalus]|uniref:paraneoplastic antigen Ma1 homolog n=1 Tax=Gadus macrocephalus TaxID=80720 RepID=UPI0028CB5EE7|nr:paraneoplastic antigen Ma1 homolog [Gadus macrocephalus]
MDFSEAVEWSLQQTANPSRTILLSNVPIHTSKETLDKVLDTVKVFGRTRIVDRRGDSTGTKLFILVETRLDLDPDSVPLEVGLEGEAGPWAVHIVESLATLNVAPEEDTFRTKLMSLLQEEGKSMEDFQAIVAENRVPKTDVNMDLVTAIGELVDKCNQVSTEASCSLSYRKLRLFSGLKPVPPGEEEYEAWMEQATQMISEWQCTDSAKRQRIVESLKGAAADIVRFLKVSTPTATATDYLSALDTAYGTTENGAHNLVKFKHTFQNEGEKLSVFLYRLDKLLHCALLKEGIKAAEMNRARMEQLIKGALTHDMVALRIRISHTRENPPSFSQLMREVREEENWISAREGVKTTVTASTTTVPPSAVLSELNSLRNEVNELSSQVRKLLSITPATPKPDILTTKTTPPQRKSEVAAWDSSARVKPFRPLQPGIFCYNCRQDGHTSRECKEPEDLRKVNQKLIKVNRNQGNSQGAR